MNECILVVDDDPEIVNAIAITLEREGYPVRRAYDGLQAVPGWWKSRSTILLSVGVSFTSSPSARRIRPAGS